MREGSEVGESEEIHCEEDEERYGSHEEQRERDRESDAEGFVFDLHDCDGGDVSRWIDTTRNRKGNGGVMGRNEF